MWQFRCGWCFLPPGWLLRCLMSCVVSPRPYDRRDVCSVRKEQREFFGHERSDFALQSDDFLVDPVIFSDFPFSLRNPCVCNGSSNVLQIFDFGPEPRKHKKQKKKIYKSRNRVLGLFFFVFTVQKKISPKPCSGAFFFVFCFFWFPGPGPKSKISRPLPEPSHTQRFLRKNTKMTRSNKKLRFR